jgi:kynureninase
MLMLKKGKEVFEALKQQGVIADWREPNVIRVAPVPLYNNFTDVYTFGQIVKAILNTN